MFAMPKQFSRRGSLSSELYVTLSAIICHIKVKGHDAHGPRTSQCCCHFGERLLGKGLGGAGGAFGLGQNGINVLLPCGDARAGRLLGAASFGGPVVACLGRRVCRGVPLLLGWLNRLGISCWRCGHGWQLCIEGKYVRVGTSTQICIETWRQRFCARKESYEMASGPGLAGELLRLVTGAVLDGCSVQASSAGAAAAVASAAKSPSSAGVASLVSTR